MATVHLLPLKWQSSACPHGPSNPTSPGASSYTLFGQQILRTRSFRLWNIIVTGCQMNLI